ncbi:MAG TPA: tRNA pseudouridine(55) synthase TruB [Humibacter sp.]|nr:tRNA pseudouridine(55) synthase TruB [Humibacter sp.]
MSASKPHGPAASGILLVDKPGGWTSHDVVARVRRLAGTRKVGHAGTLDPMATGLLVVGVGTATRLLTFLVGTHKQYEATIRLGASTTTDDAEGEVVTVAPPAAIATIQTGQFMAAMAALTGDIMQVPSSVSAIKVDGKRAYARVRNGEDVDLPARPVTVSAFELLSSQPVDAEGRPGIDLRVRIDCSSGTYVRALARDLGEALGVGAHLTALRRTAVGPFTIAEAAELEELPVAERLLTPTQAATRIFDRFDLSVDQAVDLGHGKRLPVDALTATTSRPIPPERAKGPFAAVAPDGRLVGLVEVRDGATRVLVNFPADPAGAPNAADPAGPVGPPKEVDDRKDDDS